MEGSSNVDVPKFGLVIVSPFQGLQPFFLGILVEDDRKLFFAFLFVN